MTKEELISQMKADPMLFGKVCLPNMFTVPSPPFHYELVDAYLNPDIRKMVVQAPRGHAKSSLFGCLLVLHHLMFDEGKKFVLLVSKTEGHASRLLQTIQNVLEYSPNFRAVFGYHGMQVARVWTKTETALDTGDYILARGTGQMVVGLKYGDQRPTMILLDDPEDMMNTKTIEAMEHNLKWLLQSLIPARDALRGRVFVIGTPQHQRCMIEILRTMEGWTSFWYSAEKDPETQTSLWPELWSWEKLMKEREGAESIHRLSTYLREYCCTIVSDDEALFKDEYFRYYEAEFKRDKYGNGYLEFPDGKKKSANIYIGVDPAVSTNENADYTVIMPVAVDYENNRYILPFVRRRMRPSEVVNEIIAMNNKWKPFWVRIDVGGQQEIYSDIIKNLEAERVRLVTFRPKEKKSKLYLEGLEPWFFKRKVFMRQDMRELKDELLAFRPDMRHKHDDMLDAMYYAFHRALPAVKRESSSSDAREVTYRRRTLRNSWQLS
jgi:predicted phage terminase large subunit-like protein